jgi:dolichol-phosphate mannosyltransferase
LVISGTLRYAELPYKFKARVHGESKLESMVALEFVHLLLEKTCGRVVPVRFLLFAIVGAVGVAVKILLLF